MRLLTLVGLLAGLILTGYLISLHDVDAVWTSLVAVGWGFVLICLLLMLNIVVDAQCFRLIFPPAAMPSYWRVVWGTFVSRAVNTLLPMAAVGGELVKARIVIQGGSPGVLVGAATVVDKTVQAASLSLWGLFGLAVLLASGAEGGIVRGAALAVIGLGLGAAGFVLVQRTGALASFARRVQILFGRRAGARVARFVDIASCSDEALKDTYRRPWRFVAAVLLMTVSRVFTVLEVWLVARLIGLPIDFLDALMLESLTSAIRGAIFVVPVGIGVQESAFVLLGALFGWPAEAMLAISLATRGREIVLAIPGLIGWQIAESRILFRRVKRPRAAEG
ncbi:MAG: lysylphosphatidylglycerol synthase domain-containing protein [Proteobacteria bacterium]|nr:lysylphosphatidylglycerol synthase domain-containing protein [Pseudomonadota bacterium]